MNIPDYTPQEMVRLALLNYDTPEGMHPVEQGWRDLARKLMQHVKAAEELTETALAKISYKTDEQKSWKPYKFPSVR